MNALTKAVIIVLVGFTATSAQVQHGSINVIENDGNNNPTSVTVTRSGGDGAWIVISDDGVNVSNRGDYTVDFLSGNDTANGVLITAPYEGGRSEPSVTDDPYYVTFSTAQSSVSNRYFIATHLTPQGSEANMNPAFAWFPFADGWLGGSAYNTSNNGQLTEWFGSSAIELKQNNYTGSGLEFSDSSTSTGEYILSLEGYDLRRDGVVLACGAKNEDNRVAVNIGLDGRAKIKCIDNGSESGGENDPAAVIFIPDGTAGVTMGRISGSGRALYSQGEFTISRPGPVGTFRIVIPGESPSTGTLVVVSHTELSGLTNDNLVYVTPEMGSWKIETFDIASTGLTLQDAGAADVAFHFAFFKNGVNITPGTPDQSYQAKLNDIVSARFHVTENTSGNSIGNMRAERTLGSDGLGVFGDNRGDINISYFNARPAALTNYSMDTSEGLFLPVSTEFYRDNSSTGGVSGWGITGFDNSGMRTHVARATSEINSDFAIAMFPASLGFQQGADISVPNGVTTLSVYGNAEEDGVLLVTNWDNNNRVIQATPGSNMFTIRSYEGSNGAVATSSVEYGYVYLPYDLPTLIAGRINADGTVASGTGGFTIAQTLGDDDISITKITIASVDSRTDGVLLLTATDGPHAMAWESMDDGSFAVGALNLQNGDVEHTGFMFAWIPFEAPCFHCHGDLNGDCLVNGDDAAILIANLGSLNASYATGDLDRDQKVDLRDFAVMQIDFLQDCDNIGVGPDDPTLVWPINNSSVSGSETLLMAGVSNESGDPMNVTFFGREINNDPPFVMVTLPDTQNYSEDDPEMFELQTQWTIDNRETKNIRYLSHLGDIVQRAERIWEWENADAAISILDTQPDFPYGLTVGNHDQEPCCGHNPEGTENFNLFFPYTRYESRDWYGGHYGTDNDNHYCYFSAGDMDFMVIHLERDDAANTDVLDWIDNLVDTHPNHRVVICTHWMVGGGNPAPFSAQGRQIYERIKDNPNVFMMLGGHVCGPEGFREDTHDGHTVYSMLTDYQCRAEGGSGWLRYYEFQPANNQIVAKTYSPYLNQYELDVDSQFVMPYDMSDTEFVYLGTAMNVDNNSTATLNWSGLESGKRYEWYVVVQDSQGRTTSKSWFFGVQ